MACPVSAGCSGFVMGAVSVTNRLGGLNMTNLKHWLPLIIVVAVAIVAFSIIRHWLTIVAGLVLIAAALLYVHTHGIDVHQYVKNLPPIKLPGK